MVLTIVTLAATVTITLPQHYRMGTDCNEAMNYALHGVRNDLIKAHAECRVRWWIKV